jgi:hypothetical protein
MRCLSCWSELPSRLVIAATVVLVTAYHQTTGHDDCQEEPDELVAMRGWMQHRQRDDSVRASADGDRHEADERTRWEALVEQYLVVARS